MSAEAVAKKRGRPKKAAENSVISATGGDELPTVTTSKRSTKSRTLSTTETKSATSKKASRRKQVETIDAAPPDELEAQKTSKPTRPTAKSKASKSTILDEATAFVKLKQSSRADTAPQPTKYDGRKSAVTDNETRSGPAEQVLEALQLKSAPKSMAQAPLNTNEATQPKTEASISSSTNGESVVNHRQPAAESSAEILEGLQLDSKSAAAKPPLHVHQNTMKPLVTNEIPPTSQSQPAQSSFLSSFLSDKFQEPVPVASEEDKISDRTLFNSPKFAAEDIVSGPGVSDLSSVLASSTRKPAIPLKQPKTFKAHKLSAFEHGPHESLHPRQKANVKQVEPETFAASSFKAFKIAEPTILTSAPIIEPEKVGFTQAKSTVLPAQGSVADQPSPLPVKSQSQPQPQSTRLPPVQPQPQTQPPNSSHPQPATSFPPKLPTQMTYNELRRNQNFKSLRRKWTGLIVGVPVLVVTSYVLWNRLEMEERLEGVRGSRVGEGGMRERGVVPVPVHVPVPSAGGDLDGSGKGKEG